MKTEIETMPQSSPSSCGLPVLQRKSRAPLSDANPAGACATDTQTIELARSTFFHASEVPFIVSCHVCPCAANHNFVCWFPVKAGSCTAAAASDRLLRQGKALAATHRIRTPKSSNYCSQPKSRHERCDVSEPIRTFRRTREVTIQRIAAAAAAAALTLTHWSGKSTREEGCSGRHLGTDGMHTGRFEEQRKQSQQYFRVLT